MKNITVGTELITVSYPEAGLKAVVTEVIIRKGHKLGELFVKTIVIKDGKEIELEELPMKGYFVQEESTKMIDVIEKLTEGNYEINNKLIEKEVNLYHVIKVESDRRGIYLLTNKGVGHWYRLQYIKARGTYRVVAAS